MAALSEMTAYKVAAEVTKTLIRRESENRLLRLENELLRRQLLDASPLRLGPHHEQRCGSDSERCGSDSELAATFRAAQECSSDLEALYLAIVAQLRLHSSVESELISFAQSNVMLQQRIQHLSEACDEHTSIIADALRRELAEAHRVRASPGSMYVASGGRQNFAPDDP